MRQPVSERFLLREWDDGCVIFDRRFGNTHALNSVTAEVFNALLAAPDEEPQQVLARMRPSGQGEEAQWQQAIEQALEQLTAHQLTGRD